MLNSTGKKRILMKISKVVSAAAMVFALHTANASIESERIAAVEDVVKSIAWEAIENSSKSLVSQLILQSGSAKELADLHLEQALRIEKGAIAMAIKGTSPELRLAASKWMRVSVELKDSADNLRTISKSDAAKGAAWLGANIAIWQNIYDNYKLFKESSTLASKYPNFNLAASPSEYIATSGGNLVSFGVGKAISYFAAQVAPTISGGALTIGLVVLLKPNEMGFEEYDLIPSGGDRLRKWVVFMNDRAQGYKYSESLKNGTATGIDVPGGLIQYLQIMDRQAPSKSMAWVHNWAITADSKVWVGPPPPSNASITLTLNTTRWDFVSPLVVSAKSKGSSKSAAVQVYSPSGQLVLSANMVPLVNYRDGSADWSADLTKLAAWRAAADGAYRVRAVVVDGNGKSVSSADVPLEAKHMATAPVGSISTPMPNSIQVNATALMTGTAAGKGQPVISVIYPDLNAIDKVTTNAQGAWEYKKVFVLDGNFNFRVEVSDDSGLASTVLGRGTVQVNPVKAPPPVLPVTPTYSAFSLDRTEVQAGESVTITVKMSAPVDNVRVVIDQLSGGTTLALTNPSGNKTDWVKTNQPLTQPGSAANQYKRPLWAIATVAAKGDLAATAPINLTVRPTPADGMDFVTDTYKDDTVVPAGSPFTKTWTLRNTGTKPWTTAYCMVPVGGETALGSGKSCVTAPVAPNGQFTFPVVMHAPVAVNADKSYTQHWQLLNAAGVQVGTIKPYTRITVKGTAAHIVQNTMPEMVLQGNVLSFAVQTDKPAQAVALELASPNASYALQGSGTSWTLSPVLMSVAGNRAFTIKVTTAGEITDSKMGSLFIRGSGTGGGVPLAQVTNVSANPPDVVVGQAVQFTVQTDAKVKAMTIRFDSATASPTTMGNPSGNGVDWVFNNFAATPGQVGNGYARSYWVSGTRADGSSISPKGPYQVLVRPATTGPLVSTVTPASGMAGQKVRIVVGGKSLPAALKIQLTGSQCSASLAGDLTRREYDCTLGAAVGAHPLTVLGLQDAILTTRRFDVVAAPGGGASAPVIPPVPLNPQLSKLDSVQAGVPWSAKLATNVPVDSADLVFSTGRRIPFDGGPLNWATRDENARFSEAGSVTYELQIRRTAAAAVEKFAGGTLTVTPQPVVPVAPNVASVLQVEQGKPYNLQVSTDKPADRVMVKWPDSTAEQGLRALDAQRTQWEFGSRLFMQAQPVAFAVSVYKDGVAAPVGSIAKTLVVTAPAGGLRLVSTSNAILQGESPFFTFASTLSIAKVTVQLGSNAPVTLAALGGSGAEQSFRGQVLASLSGPSVPWQAVGYNAQGQEMARVAGTVAVAAPGDALRAASPVPAAGIAQGDAVEWQFLTVKSPEEMWMEFASPIGNVPLVGSYFRRVFNEAPGKYAYRLMRRDHLGNVFAIQGASGTLTINPRTIAAPVIGQLSLNGRAVGAGGKVTLSLKENLSVLAQAAGAKGLVLKVSIPQSVGDVYFKLGGSNGVQWQSNPLPSSLGDYFRGQVKPGVYAAQVYLGSGGTDLATNLGGTVNFNLELAP